MVLRRTRRGPRRGMTLAELLVVVAIVVILIAVMLPRLRPVMESSKLRESARQVNAYFSMAQSLAGERGRPVGVQIERQLGSKGAFLLSLVEVPMPYSGDTINARAEISSGGSARLKGAQLYPTSPRPRAQVGDYVRFNYQGAYYPIASVSATSIRFESDGFAALPAPTVAGAVGVPFQIYRRPVKSSVSPLELTAPTAIDLSASGHGLASNQFNQTDLPIVITFAPGGRLDRIYQDGAPLRPEGPVFLLVGRSNQLPGAAGAGAKDKPFNMLDPGSIWVAVNHRTGLTTTASNGTDGSAGAPSDLASLRQFALRGQNMGAQ